MSFDQIVQDVRYGLRMIRRNPAFAMTVVMVLALAIGMNTAVFTVANTVLLRPLGYPDSERLIWLTNYDYRIEHRDIHVRRSTYLQWREQATSFESMVAYSNQDLTLIANGESSQERIASITDGFWNVLGAKPAFGRLFGPAESNVIVITHALFARRFGSDPAVIGRTIDVDGHAMTIAGVLQPDFRFLLPQMFVPGDEVRDIDAYVPLSEALLKVPENNREWEQVTRRFGPAHYNVRVIAKLEPDVSIDSARTEMAGIYSRVMKGYPEFLQVMVRLNFMPLQEKVIGGARHSMLVLLACVGFVLTIAAANVANLMLARSSARQREVAIRAAMGAGRGRVVRQFLVEGVLLAGMGGGVGLALAHLALPVLVSFGSHSVPRLNEAVIDGRVLAFTAAISLATGLLFACAPAISVWRRALAGSLTDTTRTASASVHHVRRRAFLIAGELALAVVLLSGAGLMLKSYWRMNIAPPGFEPENILVMRVPLASQQYQSWQAKSAYIDEIFRRLKTVPGVQAVGITGVTYNVAVTVQPAAPQVAAVRMVSPGYLRAIGVPLIEGRWPEEREALDSVLINQTFARRLGAGSVVGREIRGSFLRGAIVGVVADFKHSQLDAQPIAEVYYPYQLSPVTRSIRVLVRTSADAQASAQAIRKVVSGIDPSQPVYEVQTLERALSDSIAPRRFNLFLLSTFAVTALALAVVGIYGVTSYSVAQRTREIGVRMALGAQRGAVLRAVVGEGMAVACVGIAAGTIAALALTRTIASLLYDVQPHDAPTFLAVTVVLVLTALLASLGPALRAAWVDPVVALRSE